MSWLKNFWDEYSWLLFLPMVLGIGTLLILAIVGIRFGIIYIFQNVPFPAWGSFLGGAFLFAFGWYLKAKISENKGLDWNLAAQIGSISIVFGAIGLLILTASIVWIFLPATVNSFWEIAQNVGFFLLVLLVFYAFIYVCGEFIAQGIILIRRGVLSGFFLILIALVGIAPIFFKIIDLFLQNLARQNWLTAVFFGTIFVLIVGFLVIYAVIPAFRANKKDESNQ